MSDSVRVPTDKGRGWTVETALDYLNGIIAAHDVRYEQTWQMKR